MPTWAEVQLEILQLRRDANPDPLGAVRQKYLQALSAKTGRTTIAYYSGWLSNPAGMQMTHIINDDDKSGFMQAAHKVAHKTGLDLVLHTPGGSVTAAESIVDYLLKLFKEDIRVIVPQIAMSAGAMIACASREIVMGHQSNLGPIDPQVNGLPAYDVISEFDRAVKESSDPGAAQMWQTIIGKYHPTFLSSCEHAIALSKEIVQKWLEQYMFAGQKDAKEKATHVVECLSSREGNREHGRHIHAERCKEIGLNVTALESDQDLQELVLTVHHGCIYSMSQTGWSKLIENQVGATFVR